MADYPVLDEGFDPTAVATAIQRAELLAMVHDAQPASTVGYVVLADSAPDVALYPVLARFRWAKTSGGNLTGLFYYHDGTSWTLEVPAPGTILGSMLVDKSISILKLSPDGDPFDIIQLNAAADSFVFVKLLDAINAGTLPINKFEAASAAYSFMVSNASNVWSELGTLAALNRLLPAPAAATTFNSFDNDTIAYFRNSSLAAEKQTVAFFTENIISQAPLITATAGAMLVPVVDLTAAAGSRAKRVSLTNLLPASGVTAGTYSGNLSVTVGANGIVTAISTVSTSTYSTAPGAEVALPTAAGTANRVTIPHGLSAKPRFYTAFIICTDAGGDAGYSYQAEEPLSVLRADTGSAAYNIAFGITVDATNIYVTRPTGNICIMNNTTGAFANLDTTKWKLRGYATL